MENRHSDSISYCGYFSFHIFFAHVIVFVFSRRSHTSLSPPDFPERMNIPIIAHRCPFGRSAFSHRGLMNAKKSSERKATQLQWRLLDVILFINKGYCHGWRIAISMAALHCQVLRLFRQKRRNLQNFFFFFMGSFKDRSHVLTLNLSFWKSEINQRCSIEIKNYIERQHTTMSP